MNDIRIRSSVYLVHGSLYTYGRCMFVMKESSEYAVSGIVTCDGRALSPSLPRMACAHIDHLKRLQPPKLSQSVHREECTQCFDNQVNSTTLK